MSARIHAHTTPVTPAVFAAVLNRRFAAGRPSNDWARAGVLMHVFDGGGLTMAGRTDFPDPRMSWTPGMDPKSRHNDRLGATLINWRHPDVYRCIVCPPDLVDMPGVVLSVSDVMCPPMTRTHPRTPGEPA